MNYTDLGFIRVALLSPAVELGRPKINSEKLTALWQQAESEGALIAMNPELGLTGYTCEDWFHSDALLKDCEDAIASLMTASKKLKSILILGAPARLNDGRLFNAAWVIHQGKVCGVVPKTYLPNSGEFYERRWFQAGFQVDEWFRFRGIECRLSQQVFSVETNKGESVHFGVEICHDLWAAVPPSQGLALQGAQIIFNLSASNEVVGKPATRRTMVQEVSTRLSCAYVYASSNPSESSKDTVFGGQQFVAVDGEIILETKPFQAPALAFADIDCDRIANARSRDITFGESVQFYRGTSLPKTLIFTSAFPEIKTLQTKPNPAPFPLTDNALTEALNIQVEGLRRRAEFSKAKSLLVGLSGGLDSTLALRVAIETAKKLPGLKVIGITMPGPGTSQKTLDIARALIQKTGITLKEVAITAAVEQHLADLGQAPTDRSVTYENAQARERTQILFDLANSESGIVVGTGDLSELALGWCTFNADQMAHYGVNAGIPKTAVRAMVAHWAENAAENAELASILNQILALPISPELLPPAADGSIAQETEKVLGPYEIHDFVLYHFLKYGSKPEKIRALAQLAFSTSNGGKHDAALIDHTLQIFFTRFSTQQFKRTTLPPGPKVFEISLSPRADWRSPDEMAAVLLDKNPAR